MKQLSLTLLLIAIPAMASADDGLATSRAPVEQAATAPSAPAIAGFPGLADEPSAEWGDGRRTMARFGANLGRNFTGVFARESLRPLAIGVVLAGTGALLDGRTERFFEARPRAPRLGNVGQTLGGLGVMGPAAGMLFLAGRGSSDTRFRAATYDLMQATLVAQSYTTALKLTVGRTRPDGSNDLSFPSGHTSNAFALATVAHHHYGARAGALAYGAAGLIGISRLEKDVHHLSDVLAGAALGYVIGRTVVRQDAEPLRGRRQLSLVPVADPSGRGVGLGVSLAF